MKYKRLYNRMLIKDIKLCIVGDSGRNLTDACTDDVT